MRPSNNLENKIPTETLKGSSSICESSGSQFFRTTTGKQSRPDAFDKSRLVMTFSSNLQVTEILHSFRLDIEKTGKEIPASSRLEFLEKILANNFALSDTKTTLDRRIEEV